MVRRWQESVRGKECAKSYNSAACIVWDSAAKHPDTNRKCAHTNDQHTHTGQMPTCWTHVAEWSSCRGVLMAPEGRYTLIHSSCPLQFFNNFTYRQNTQLNDTWIQTVLFIHDRAHTHTPALLNAPSSWLDFLLCSLVGGWWSQTKPMTLSGFENAASGLD